MSQRGDESRSNSAVVSAAFMNRRFKPGYDFAYRFPSSQTFKRVRLQERPYTSPSLSSTGLLRSGRYQDAYAKAVASAQSPSPEAIKQSLGDGLLMLQRGNQYVNPSTFTKLNEMYHRNKESVKKEPPSTAPGFIINIQPAIPVRSPKRGSRISLSRKEKTRSTIPRISRGVQTSFNPGRRPSNEVGLVVDFLTSGEKQKLEAMRRRSIGRSDYYSTISDASDKCTRCSKQPDIQLEGRSLSRMSQSRDSALAREFCDVLGPSICTDCIRTRMRNQYQRMCDATVAANATDVYKLALIHEKIPHLSIREVTRKIYDGEISDAVSNLSRWREMQQHLPLAGVEQANEKPDANETEPKLGMSEKTSRSKLRSRGSVASAIFQTIVEASETTETERMDGDTETKIVDTANNEGHQVVITHHEGEQMRKIDLVGTFNPQPGLSRSPNATEVENSLQNEGEAKETQAESKHEENSENIDNVQAVARLDADSQMTVNVTTSAHSASGGRSREQRKAKKKSDSRQKTKPVKVFNKNVTPSPNYFYNVADLYERIQKSRKISRKSSWDDVKIVDPDRLPTANDTEEKNEVELKDDASVDSTDSFTPRTIQSLMRFEPPVMFEKKGRYLGVKSPPAGKLASKA